MIKNERGIDMKCYCSWVFTILILYCSILPTYCEWMNDCLHGDFSRKCYKIIKQLLYTYRTVHRTPNVDLNYPTPEVLTINLINSAMRERERPNPSQLNFSVVWDISEFLWLYLSILAWLFINKIAIKKFKVVLSWLNC